MTFDRSLTPRVQNQNFFKSQKVIEANLEQEKAKTTLAKKRFERRFERNFNKWREYDLLTCLIAFVGLALAIVDFEYTMNSTSNIIRQQDMCTEKASDKCMRAYANVRLQLSQSNFVRVVIVIVSVFGIVTLYYRHSVKARWLNEDLPFELINSQYFLMRHDEINLQGLKRRVWF